MTVRDKVMSVAGHRVQMSSPTPMEVDWIGQEDWGGVSTEDGGSVEWSWSGDEWSWGEGEEAEVQYVGKGGSSQCLRCGGWGHFARECGTPKGKGKGKGEKGWKGQGKGWKGGGHDGKGKGKTSGKGFGYQGVVNYGKGGKGYQGICWKCGEVGHKAVECGGNEYTGGVEAKKVECMEVGGV